MEQLKARGGGVSGKQDRIHSFTNFRKADICVTFQVHFPCIISNLQDTYKHILPKYMYIVYSTCVTLGVNAIKTERRPRNQCKNGTSHLPSSLLEWQVLRVYKELQPLHQLACKLAAQRKKQKKSSISKNGKKAR